MKKTLEKLRDYWTQLTFRANNSLSYWPKFARRMYFGYVAALIAILTCSFVPDDSIKAGRSLDSLEKIATVWQVQTTLFAVGFAGLAIAVNLFSESPLAVGGARGAVWRYVNAMPLLYFGLTSSFSTGICYILGISTPYSELIGAMGVSTIIATLFHSLFRVIKALSEPAIVEQAMIEELIVKHTERLRQDEEVYRVRRRQLEEYWDSGSNAWNLAKVGKERHVYFRGPERVVKGIKIHELDEANNLIAEELRGQQESPSAETLKVVVRLSPGDRIKASFPAFSIPWGAELKEGAVETIERKLLESVVLEKREVVTVDEALDQDLEALKDATIFAFNSGRLGRARKALTTINRVIRMLWANLDDVGSLELKSGFSATRRDWLTKIPLEVERFASLSEEVADLLLDGAIERLLDAQSLKKEHYVRQCLLSLERMYCTLDVSSTSDFSRQKDRIISFLRRGSNGTFYFGRGPTGVGFLWSLIEIAKSALDQGRIESAKRVVSIVLEVASSKNKLGDLALGGVLLLAAWMKISQLDLSSSLNSEIESTDFLRPESSADRIIAARKMIDQEFGAFVRWKPWEFSIAIEDPSVRTARLDWAVDEIVLNLLMSSNDQLPDIEDSTSARLYKRLINFEPGENHDGQRLASVREKVKVKLRDWREVELARLSLSEVSESIRHDLIVAVRRIAENSQSLVEVLSNEAAEISIAEISMVVDSCVRLPKSAFVEDALFDETFSIADVAKSVIDASRFHEDFAIITALLDRCAEEVDSMSSDKFEFVLDAFGWTLHELVVVEPMNEPWSLLGRAVMSESRVSELERYASSALKSCYLVFRKSDIKISGHYILPEGSVCLTSLDAMQDGDSLSSRGPSVCLSSRSAFRLSISPEAKVVRLLTGT